MPLLERKSVHWSTTQETIQRMYDTLLHKPKNSGRFASLMELYENNYLLIRLLVPELRALAAPLYVSRVDGAMSLELRDIQHSRYTTTFTLTYRFSTPGRAEREPNLHIRIYHDARTCEVMSGLISSDRSESRRVRDLLDGQRLNRFLQRWVGFCLRQGHRFSADSVEQPDGVSPTAADSGNGKIRRSLPQSVQN